MKFCLRVIEKMRRILPRDLLIDRAEKVKVGEVQSFIVFRDGKKQYTIEKVILIVKLRQTVETVSITTQGTISMGLMVTQLLDGLIRGYEYLGKEPFWDNV